MDENNLNSNGENNNAFQGNDPYNMNSNPYPNQDPYAGTNPDFNQNQNPYASMNPDFNQNQDPYASMNPDFNQNQDPYAGMNSDFNQNQDPYASMNPDFNQNQDPYAGMNPDFNTGLNNSQTQTTSDINDFDNNNQVLNPILNPVLPNDNNNQVENVSDTAPTLPGQDSDNSMTDANINYQDNNNFMDPNMNYQDNNNFTDPNMNYQDNNNFTDSNMNYQDNNNFADPNMNYQDNNNFTDPNMNYQDNNNFTDPNMNYQDNNNFTDPNMNYQDNNNFTDPNMNNNQNFNQNFGNSNASGDYNMDFVKAWMGTLYDKAHSKKFNWCAAIFGEIYLLYRKMYLTGCLFAVLRLLLAFLTIFLFTKIGVSAFALLAVVFVAFLLVYGLGFYPLYRNFVKNKLNKLKQTTPDNSQLINLASQKGNTSVIAVILYCVIVPIITWALSALLIAANILNFASGFINPGSDIENEINNEIVEEFDYQDLEFTEGYSIEYDALTWFYDDTDNTLTKGDYVLAYSGQSVTDIKSVYNLDVTNANDRSSLLNSLVSNFQSQASSLNLSVQSGTSNFVTGTSIPNVYYSYIDVESADAISRYYLILLPEDDTLFQFTLNVNDTTVDNMTHTEVISILTSASKVDNLDEDQDSSDNGNTLNDDETVGNTVVNEVDLNDTNVVSVNATVDNEVATNETVSNVVSDNTTSGNTNLGDFLR